MNDLIPRDGLHLQQVEPGDIVTIEMDKDGSWQDHIFQVTAVSASSAVLVRLWLLEDAWPVCESPRVFSRKHTKFYEAAALWKAVRPSDVQQ
jgi:hypothetical protein